MTDLDDAMALFDAIDTPEVTQELMPQGPEAMFDELRDPNLTKVLDPDLRRVVDEIKHIAFANIVDVWQSDVIIDNDDPLAVPRIRTTLKDFTQLPREFTAAIQSIKVKDGDVEIKMYDKQVAQEKLMKHYGGYAKENAQKGEAHAKLMDLLFLGAEATGMPVPKSNDA